MQSKSPHELPYIFIFVLVDSFFEKRRLYLTSIFRFFCFFFFCLYRLHEDDMDAKAVQATFDLETDNVT